MSTNSDRSYPKKLTGRRLKQAFGSDKNIYIEDLAKACSTSVNAINYWTSRGIPECNLINVAEYFSLRPSDFTNGDISDDEFRDIVLQARYCGELNENVKISPQQKDIISADRPYSDPKPVDEITSASLQNRQSLKKLMSAVRRCFESSGEDNLPLFMLRFRIDKYLERMYGSNWPEVLKESYPELLELFNRCREMKLQEEEEELGEMTDYTSMRATMLNIILDYEEPRDATEKAYDLLSSISP